MFYGMLVSFAAEVTWDIIGGKAYEVCRKFPYRLIHKSKLPIGLCETCYHYHEEGHKHVRSHRRAA